TRRRRHLHPQPSKKINLTLPLGYVGYNNGKSHRDLMCVGRYAAKVMRNERSEMEHNRSEMPANVA
ncbi:MAG: hypothetical protein SPH37_09910, partial [Sodaliphilus sp.]|nr:hypothetical protein [Sodaliphilus sp.]